MSAQTAADLTAARDLILRYGWIQGAPGNKRAGFCAYGAIAQAALYRDRRDDAWAAFRAAVPGHRLIEWNDEPGRTEAEVIAAFDKAIATEESTS